MTLMLIDRSAAQKMERALKLGIRATAEQASEWMARRTSLSGGIPRNLSVVDGVAEVRVEGVLSKRPDFWSWYLYGANTTYESIIQAIALAEADQTIKRVAFFYDTPGGYVDGLFDAIAAIEAMSKPRSARGCYACSAGYGLASVSGKIEATNEAAEFGSVGVAASYFLDESIIDITSTEAPNKRPDPSTAEGKAVIVAELDAIHDLFAGAIARGRKTTVELINANYGRGGVLLAGAAKKAGMIDKIAKAVTRAGTVTTMPDSSDGDEQPEAQAGQPVASVGDTVKVAVPAPAPNTSTAVPPAAPAPAPETNAPAGTGGAQKKGKPTMNKDELRAQQPELAAAYDTEKQTAVAAATEEERKRVLDHIQLGESCGDMSIAFAAIKAGTSTMHELANYQSASMKRAGTANRQADSNAALTAIGGAGAAPAAEGKTKAELVADAIEKQLQGESGASA